MVTLTKQNEETMFAVPIPKRIFEELGWAEWERVAVIVEDGKIVISKEQQKLDYI